MTAEFLIGFTCWEEVQMAFRVGIVLSNGERANAIGRHPNLLMDAVKTGRVKMLWPCNF